jgi:hypothetical protein
VRIDQVSFVSLALLAALTGCSSSGDAAPSESTESAPATASPTPATDPAAVVAFQGDCAEIVSDEEAIGLIGNLDSPLPPPELSWNLQTDLSAAIISGIRCSWLSSDYSGFAVGAFPVSMVPEALQGEPAGIECDEYAGCEGALVIGDTWVNVASASREVADAVVGIIQSDADAAGSPRPGPWSDTWWAPLTDCAGLQDPVAAALGVSSLVPNFPSDTLPTGPVVDVLDANGVVVECPWFSYESSTGAIVYVQPGIGAPAADLTTQAGVVPVDVAGADSAFFASSGNARPRLLAASGPNRVTIEGLPGVTEDALAPVATAVLRVLDAP